MNCLNQKSNLSLKINEWKITCFLLVRGLIFALFCLYFPIFYHRYDCRLSLCERRRRGGLLELFKKCRALSPKLLYLNKHKCSLDFLCYHE